MAKNEGLQELIDAAENLLKVFWDEHSRHSQVAAAWSRLRNALDKIKAENEQAREDKHE